MINRLSESRRIDGREHVEYRRQTARSRATQGLSAASELAQQSELMQSEVDKFLTEVKAVV